MKKSPLFFMLLFVVGAWAQHNKVLDSILSKAYASKDSSQYYFNVSEKYIKTTADSASYYYFKFYKHNTDQTADSIDYYSKKVIPLLTTLDSLNRLRKVYEQLQFKDLRAGNYDGAINHIQHAITLAEKMKDTGLISLHLSDKSIIYHDFEDFEQGVKYGKKAYQVMDKANHKIYKYLIFANNATAINFDDWNKPDSALYYHFKNIKLLKHVKDTLPFTFIFNNIGNTLLKQKKYTEAKKYLSKALSLNLRRERDYNLASNYTNLATIAYQLNNYSQAEIYFHKANFHAKKSHSIEKIRDVLQQEAWYYKKRGDFKTALQKQEAFYKLRDSVFNDERAKKVAELETQYQTEKKERKIQEQRAVLAEKELQIKQKNLLVYGSLGLALILGMLGYLLYNQQKIKNQQLKKENELKTALAKIETQNKLQEQRLRISRDLHDNIGAQLTFVISSIDNLNYGQKKKDKTVSTKLEQISDFTRQTINELRDTIWAMNKDKITCEDLYSRISNFIEKAGQSHQTINFNFTICKTIAPQTQFSSIAGINIYRIIQEAVNNSLKHAKASVIQVKIEQEKENFILTILDNGKGFDVLSTQQGNGLNNLKKRADNIGGKTHIQSDNNGTTIRVIFPKQQALTPQS